MAYFPFFMDITGKKCAVIGGGTVALRKLEKLLPFGVQPIVTAPEICPAIRSLPVQLQERSFRDEDLDGVIFAIAATDDRALNHHIYELCNERHILCNAVDDKENCSFIFPALVHSGDITVGVSTGGTSPAFAKLLRRRIDSLLDERMLRTAALMKALRPHILASCDTEEMRLEAAQALLELCLSSDALPDDDDIFQLLEAIRTHEHPDRNEGEQTCTCTGRAGGSGDPPGISGGADRDHHHPHQG